jgi:hypothetical protein
MATGLIHPPNWDVATFTKLGHIVYKLAVFCRCVFFLTLCQTACTAVLSPLFFSLSFVEWFSRLYVLINMSFSYNMPKHPRKASNPKRMVCSEAPYQSHYSDESAMTLTSSEARNYIPGTPSATSEATAMPENEENYNFTVDDIFGGGDHDTQHTSPSYAPTTPASLPPDDKAYSSSSLAQVSEDKTSSWKPADPRLVTVFAPLGEDIDQASEPLKDTPVVIEISEDDGEDSEKTTKLPSMNDLDKDLADRSRVAEIRRAIEELRNELRDMESVLESYVTNRFGL